jgi:cytochrome c peroxidase
MKGNRQSAVELLRRHYRDAYEKLAGSLDGDVDRAFANLGKFIAAYERTLAPGPSRFDRYVEGKASLTADELAGLDLFLKPESQCLNCHNGPLFTNHLFHNIGTATLDGEHPDFGREMGVQALAFDPFHCRSAFSDAAGTCPAQDHALAGDHDGMLAGAFKTPSLRNVAITAPYFHDGSKATLEEVIEHYRNPPKAKNELKPLRITDGEARQLVAFLKTLTSLPDAVQVPGGADKKAPAGNRGSGHRHFVK